MTVEQYLAIRKEAGWCRGEAGWPHTEASIKEAAKVIRAGSPALVNARHALAKAGESAHHSSSKTSSAARSASGRTAANG
jgi:hypothetical protein